MRPSAAVRFETPYRPDTVCFFSTQLGTTLIDRSLAQAQIRCQFETSLLELTPLDRKLTADIRRLVDTRPTFGPAALLKCERRSAGLGPINAKRVYRLMKKCGLLLARHTGRRVLSVRVLLESQFPVHFST